MRRRDAHDAAGRIYDAMDDGKLKGIAIVRTGSNGSVEAWEGRTHLGGYTLEGGAADLLEFQRMFPGGRVERMGLESKAGKWAPTTDRARYITNSGPDHGDVLVIFHYFVAHECLNFSGRAETGGKPKWWCVSCKKPVTTTKAREIGLLPKLQRKGTK
ncbi:hypothetical protein SEA_LYMARA_55 [Arthrobacter phage Lymara]|uniref:Uncharacterized protein n=1 Tax=Arthrobacter phage Lymara TaxID=2599828 RepID=A0A5J6TVL1_9CAUD|nr:hypothetical protein HYQ01_gp055 [Arthrobacter phage Lymara]QFG14856.1 hypothetical protein SEA_LYMARA_55 [Arthrobacter phage Lymara]